MKTGSMMLDGGVATTTNNNYELKKDGGSKGKMQRIKRKKKKKKRDTKTDTDGAYDTTNSRFTVPAGKNGKYQFHFRVKMSGIDDNEYIRAHLYKNGTRVEASGNEFHSPGNDLQVPSQGFYAMSLVAGDYIELWCYHNEGGTRTMFGGTNEMQDLSYLQVVRLIGV